MATKRKRVEPHLQRRPLIAFTNGVPNATFGEYLTWIIRGVAVVGVYGIWYLILTLGDIKTDIAVIKQQIAAHGQQLTAIWQRLPH